MSDSHFAVPSPVPFPSPQAAQLLGSSDPLPLRAPRQGEQIILGGPPQPPVSEAPPLVREVIEGKPMPRSDPAPAAPLLSRDALEADLDGVLRQLIQEVGSAGSFDPDIPVREAAAKMLRSANLIEALNDVRVRLSGLPAILVLNR